MTPRPATILFLVAAAAGMLFAAVSTYDFVQHLDRQLHGIHCSFIPGLGALDASGASGCSAALMSPWSSVLRTWIWGGIPMSLAGMAVFAFLLFRGFDLWFGRKQDDKTAGLLLLLVSLLPVLTSLVMGGIAVVMIGELCKMCVGIYIASFVACGAAIWAWLGAGSGGRDAWDASDAERPDLEPDADRFHEADAMQSPLIPYGVATAQLGAFVLVPVLVYVMLVPDNSGYIGTCGSLTQPDDPYGVLVPLDANVAVPPVIEVLDPLCPACRGFERRFTAAGFDEEVHRQALLFPLDKECNWMVSSSLHPGACDVSAAVLCAENQAPIVLEWAFEHQEEIREAAAADPGAAGMMVSQAFPDLAGCVASNKARQRLNKSMRWAVANQLPVMMPQVFVDGVKLCDEDTDLGLDYAMDRLLDQTAYGAVAVTPPGSSRSSSVEVH